MNFFLIILIISFRINARRPGYQPSYELDYYEDYPLNGRSVRNRYEKQINRFRDEIDLRDSYIARLEDIINQLQDDLSNQNGNIDDYDDKGHMATYYASSKANQKNTVFPHDSGKVMTNKEMVEQIIPEISARMPGAKCMKSCNYLKNAKAAKDALSQYMYLMVCAEGCRKSIPCLEDNYCMPVMKENPGFFVQCVNKCELFKIAPKVFKSGRCK